MSRISCSSSFSSRVALAQSASTARTDSRTSLWADVAFPSVRPSMAWAKTLMGFMVTVARVSFPARSVAFMT